MRLESVGDATKYKALVITGWRDATDEDKPFVEEKIRAYRSYTVTTLFEGGARGVDTIARLWARKVKLKPRTHKANWGAHGGGSAGPIRNFNMVKAAVTEFGKDAVLGLAFPHASSIGTHDCISKFEHFEIDYLVFDLRAP